MKRFIALALFSASLVAQPKAKPGDVAVVQVNDRRTNGSFSQLMITLELPGIPSIDVGAMRVLVSQAVDDSGQSLLDSEAREPELETNSRALYAAGDKNVPLTVGVTLKNPARKSTAVKQVTGEIELFIPSKDPNSVAEISKFLSFSGKTLAHRALKANGVEIAQISPTQLAAEKKRLGEAKRKEYKDAGYDDETINSLVSSHLESLLNIEESDVLVRIKDPNKRIQDLSYVDAKGETKRISARDDEGFTILSLWGEKPQPDWKLRVSMKTSKNIVRYPFSLSNVPLP